jgi:hypothetical protein
MRHSFCAGFACFALLWSISVFGQTLKTRPAEQPEPVTRSAEPVFISLTVPSGTPLKVVLDRELRIRAAGQPVHGKTSEPIYSFDKLLIPAGTEVTGRVAEIESVSKKTRTLSAMNADFSPEHQIRVELDEIHLADGRLLPVHTVVSPGTNGVLQFVSASQSKQGRGAEGKAAAKGRLAQARGDAKRQLAAFKAQLVAPNKVHRLERFAMDQSPYRPQYLDPGTSFSAALPKPIAFGKEQLKPAMVESIGQLPESGGVVHAWLTTPLNSATTKRGDLVEARINQPLIVDNRLYLPESSELMGTVLQVRPARRFGRNGQLRIAFHQVVPPDGLEEQIQSTLEGMDVAKGENLALDSEGGAHVKTSKTRYLTTGIAVLLAASSASPDSDAGARAGGGGDAGGGALSGASGFKLVGTLIGAFARSRTLAAGFGAYGAARAIYGHFLARGRDVNYPKNMSMVLALGPRDKKPMKAETSAANEARIPAVRTLSAAASETN